ncbi:uracil DNA glycosylase superfamily protein [Histoplasma capsulatum G186AR]|uniref:Uracil DNA glycosylase superfamily protein n=2 Tax=Ajellomyces capsulatus TaxID=5037 RepID=C0NHF5_AJECG|nr:uracil DNA glycosylase superfamily protein [Histoplasma capsulatum G186AR]EEH09240.1 uracil DNA glycosylase superfamily protein [Histoplasma capsulatum G186AR]KAG5303423.1 uracil DNA glycosylase superfamily protein [Histoplasma capsulatum]QSS69020.1 uracil DNA glycosylase superfamily protein [Histoplasma capsulatum G186AR]
MPSINEDNRLDGGCSLPSPSFKGNLNRFIYDSPPNGSLVVQQTQSEEAGRSLKRKFSNNDVVEVDIAVSREVTRITRSVSRAGIGLLTAPLGLGKSRSEPSSPSRRNPSRQTPRASANSSRVSLTSAANFRSPARPICNLRDTIPHNLVLLFIGVNPGIMTGQTGHVYAHPSNLYWKLLHSSGITDYRHPPSDTYQLPELYSVGNTNIVERPTRDASQLSRKEMDDGVPVLERKIREKRPEAVCLVGKSIWEAVWRVRRGRAIKKEEFRYGWQDEGDRMGRTKEWKGARVFVATTTSGLAAGMTMAEKQAVWSELGEWVKRRREEREKAGIPKVTVVKDG